MITSRIWIPLCLCLAAGCTPAREFPNQRQYALELMRTTPPAELPVGASLVVQPFRIAPACAGRELVYRVERHRYETDFYHVFLTAPAAEVAQSAHRWLRASGLFGDVLADTTEVRPAFALEGSVEALWADYRDRAHPAAVIELQLALISDAAGEAAVYFEKEYAQRVAFSPAGPRALVDAWCRGLAAILDQFERDLVEKQRRMKEEAKPGTPEGS